MGQRSVHHATLVIDRRFDAAPARVFAAWADPEARARWDYSGIGWEAEAGPSAFHVGATKTSWFGPPGEPRYEEQSWYVDIVDGERIVMAYTVSRGGVRLTASLFSAEFSAEGAGTRLHLVEQGAFLDGGDTSKDRERGWGEALDKLDAELKRQAEPA